MNEKQNHTEDENAQGFSVYLSERVRSLLDNYRQILAMISMTAVVSLSIYKLFGDTGDSGMWLFALLFTLSLIIWLQTKSGRQVGKIPDSSSLTDQPADVEPATGHELPISVFARVSDYFERNSGVIALASGVSATVLLAVIAVGDMNASDLAQWQMAFWTIFAIFTITLVFLFTRTLPRPSATGPDPDEETNVLFRVSYVFVATIVVMAGTFLVSPHVFRAESVLGMDDERSARALAIVAGCDYAPPNSRPSSAVPISRSSETKTNNDGTTEIVERLVFEKGDVPIRENAVQGDSSLPIEDRVAAMPKGAHCGDIPPQWVLSIGGNILNCHINGTCWKQKGHRSAVNNNHLRDDDQAEVVEKRFSLDKGPCIFKPIGQGESSDLGLDVLTCQEILGKYEQVMVDKLREWNEIDRYKTRQYELGIKDRAEIAVSSEEREKTAISLATSQSNFDSLDILSKELETKVRQIELAVQKKKRGKELIYNIAGAPIVGGIVVPIYFLAVAILGACVGMVRKLPEFQYRSTSAYRKNHDPLAAGSSPKDMPLEQGEARDFLIFQAVQVVFAPAVALIAYSFARPQDVAAAVILAFAAGYSSEIFLVAIRDLSDRLIGLGLRPVRYSKVKHLRKKQNSLTGRRVILKNARDGYLVDSHGEILAFENGRYIVAMKTDQDDKDRTTGIIEAETLEIFRDIAKTENKGNG